MESQVLTCSLYLEVPETLNLTYISKHFMVLNILDKQLHFLVTITFHLKLKFVLSNHIPNLNEILDLPCTQPTKPTNCYPELRSSGRVDLPQS